MNKINKIGFIGIGNMGNPMAARVAAAGFDLSVHDINPEASGMFAATHGAKVAASLDQMGREVEAVITMLPTDKIVNAVILGEGGIAAALARGSVVVDMSTSDPVATQALAAALAPRGIDVVDAPVMGGVVFARDGTLDIMAAGDDAAVARVTPLLQSMGRSVIPCGAVGNAHALKALANYINACALINVVEAMTIGRKFGLEAKMMAAALLPMINGRQHPLEKKILPQVMTRNFSTGMAMELVAKDIGIAVATAKSMGAHAPLAELTHKLWLDAAAKIGGHLDQTEVARLWEQATGVTLQA